MAGRPRSEVPGPVRAEIVRQARVLRRGLPRIVRATRYPEHQVRMVMDEEGLRRPQVKSRAWDIEAPRYLRPDKYPEHIPYTHDDHLRHTLGERSPKRIAGELGRTPDAVRSRASFLGLSVQGLDMSLLEAAKLCGRDVVSLMAAARRKELAARRVDETWRVHPSQLRDWVLEDIRRVVWRESSDWYAMLGLLLGRWGNGDRKGA